MNTAKDSTPTTAVTLRFFHQHSSRGESEIWTHHNPSNP